MRARDNPFATARVHGIRYRFRGEAWDNLFRRLAALNHRGAIVGPEGAGKTTLLEDFEPRLLERGFKIVSLRLTRDTPTIDRGVLRELSLSISTQHFILFDGAEQLSRWSWWRFLQSIRRAGGLLITSHRPGLLPTLIECRTSQELLAGIVADLLQEPAERQHARAAELFSKHRGNLRDALRELYDVWSERATDRAECPPPDADRHRDRTAACRLAE